MNKQNGTTPTFEFVVVPLDCCPQCEPQSEGRFGISIPVAISVQGDQQWIVRNVCPDCRLIWDTSWDTSGDSEYGPFEDAFIRYSTGVRAHPQGGSFFPAGPRRLLEQRAE